ncbi:hypothetical protein BCV70DRAFT_53527 [Testicularia cyperi]|uniref:Transmembrane protein n=1 Tax=Testicularia cyperi TaxID=1882483 RepID=A0A317XUH6_9BASI|nr:hypothetical protein BCV70DRAFT_53527 [Testicularia cyperi]
MKLHFLVWVLSALHFLSGWPNQVLYSTVPYSLVGYIPSKSTHLVMLRYPGRSAVVSVSRGTLSGCRFVSTSTTSSPGTVRGATKASKEGFNHPRTIFYGWAALIFVAGFGYYTVKSANTAKKREFMIKQGHALQQQQLDGDGQAVDGATTQPPPPMLMSSTNQERFAQSPLQSLTAAFNRQTTQRSRTAEQSQPGDAK